MKAEKIILSTVAVIVGLVAAGVAFYLYQMTKAIPQDERQTLAVQSQITPTPTPNKEYFLTVDSPQDEAVETNKTIKISGKTSPNATIVVSTESNDQVVTPSANGSFSLTESINAGTGLIQITAIYPNGQEEKVVRTVTYTTESF